MHRPLTSLRLRFITNLKTSSVPQARTTRHQGLAQVIRVSKIQYRITEYDHQLLVLPRELASERLITRLSHHAFSDPLPELSLRGPELLPIAADHERSLLLLYLLLKFLFLRSQFYFLPDHQFTCLRPGM
jgi:hypothetical protein